LCLISCTKSKTSSQPCSTAGGVYVADRLNGRVLKLPTGSTTPVELPFAGLSRPKGVAVDSEGNIYVPDYGNRRVLKLPVQ
jgi:serine/threonine protein kinase, bacterial